jgi:hypothetical protein
MTVYRLGVQSSERRQAIVGLAVDARHDIQLLARGKFHHGVSVVPYLPLGSGLVTKDDRAKVKPAVVSECSPHVVIRPAKRAVDGRQRIGTLVELDPLLRSPGPQIAAVGKQSCEPPCVLPEPRAPINGYATGQAVLGTRQPLPPEQPHPAIIASGRSRRLSIKGQAHVRDES